MIVRVTKPSSDDCVWRLESVGQPELSGRLQETDELLAVVDGQLDCYLEIQPTETGWDVVRRVSIH